MLLMSNSLKVVNIALVFCASFNLLAIFIRMRFIFTLCSDLVPAISLVGSAGGNLTTGAAPADGRGGKGAGGGGGRLAIGAAGLGGGGGGVEGIAAAGGGGGGGGGAAAAAAITGSGADAAAGLGAAGAPPASSFNFRSLAPGATVEPSSTNSSSITPAAGEGTGTLVLSVSISQITSSSETESPTAFSHLISPSEMESAKAGHTIIFTSSRSILVVYRVLQRGPVLDSSPNTGLILTVACLTASLERETLAKFLASLAFATCLIPLESWFLPDPSMAAM